MWRLSASVRKSSSATKLVRNESRKSTKANRRPTSVVASTTRARSASTCRSLRTVSAMPGRWTFTTTSVPSPRRARCTWATEAAARGSSSKAAKTSSTGDAELVLDHLAHLGDRDGLDVVLQPAAGRRGSAGGAGRPGSRAPGPASRTSGPCASRSSAKLAASAPRPRRRPLAASRSCSSASSPAWSRSPGRAWRTMRRSTSPWRARRALWRDGRMPTAECLVRRWPVTAAVQVMTAGDRIRWAVAAASSPASPAGRSCRCPGR